MNNMKSFQAHQESLDESLGGGRDSTKSGGVKNFNFNKIVKLDGNLFKLGKDEIDTNNIQFTKAINILKPLKDSEIEVIGSASAVGNDKGFDNSALAKKRADNFVEALKKAGVNTTNYKIKSVVGKATVPNSKEADREQNVTFQLIKKGSSIRFELERDNTATVQPRIHRIMKVIPPVIKDGDYEFSVVRITHPKGKRAEILKTLNTAIKPLRAFGQDVTEEYLKKSKI